MLLSRTLSYPIIKYVVVLTIGYCLFTLGIWFAYPIRPHPLLGIYYLHFLWQYRSFWVNDMAHIAQWVPYPVVLSTTVACFIFLCVAACKKPSVYGNARWAWPGELGKFGLCKREGIIVGKKGPLLLKTDKPLCVLLFAPAGSGKTAGFIIPNLLYLKNRSLLVYDLKGELVEKTAHARRRYSKVWVFDPASPHSARYNIFAKSVMPEEEGDRTAFIANIATLLIKGTDSRKNFFILEARSAFCFFAEWLLWRHGETSFAQIYCKITEMANTKALIEGMVGEGDAMDEGMDIVMERPQHSYQGEEVPAPIVRMGKAVLMNAYGGDQWAGVLATLRQSMDVFNTTHIQMATSTTCDFTAASLRREPTTVYFKVADKDRERLQPLIAVILDALNTQFISSLPEKHALPITYILDEFIRLGKMQRLVEMPEIGRGYKVNAIFIAQDESQICKIYRQEELDSLKANCGYQVILRQAHLGTAEKISRLIGNKTRRKKSRNIQRHKQELIASSHGEAQAEEGIPFLTPQQLLSLEANTCVILVQGYFNRPMRASIPFYFRDRGMKRLVG